MMYHEIYNSEAYWKGYSKVITDDLRKLDSEAKKRETLK